MQSTNPDSSPLTATQRLASVLLQEDVRSYVEARRSQGISWRVIARSIYDDTGRQLDVSGETVRQWSQSWSGAAA